MADSAPNRCRLDGAQDPRQESASVADDASDVNAVVLNLTSNRRSPRRHRSSRRGSAAPVIRAAASGAARGDLVRKLRSGSSGIGQQIVEHDRDRIQAPERESSTERRLGWCGAAGAERRAGISRSDSLAACPSALVPADRGPRVVSHARVRTRPNGLKSAVRGFGVINGRLRCSAPASAETPCQATSLELERVFYSTLALKGTM